MSTLLKNLVSNLESKLTDFLWQEWSALGVFPPPSSQTRRLVDPEVLLLLTSEIGRYEARLFDEVLDWLLLNSRWINTQRLRSLHVKHGIGDPCVLAAIARSMMEHDPATKLRNLSLLSEGKQPPEGLFRTGYSEQRSSFEAQDRIFEQYGLLRTERSPRSYSKSVAMAHPCSLQFRLRALFGLGMRADILSYLLTHDGAHPSGIAQFLGYSQKRVQDTLVEMVESGQVQVRSSGRMKIYQLDKNSWAEFLVPGSANFCGWIYWLPLARGITTIWREIWAIDPACTDDYTLSSKLRTAMRAARDDMHASGITFNITDDKSYIAEAYLHVFEQDMSRMLSAVMNKAT